MTTPPFQSLPVLGLMLGDATGIGPEQCARILADRRMADVARLVIVGDARVLEQGMRDAGVAIAWHAYGTPEHVDWARDEIPIIDLHNLDPGSVRRGAGVPCGRAVSRRSASDRAGRSGPPGRE